MEPGRSTTAEPAIGTQASPLDRNDEHAKKGGNSTITVIAAILGNILVGIVKFIAAGISGSAAMVSEGIHSIVDSGNGILVLYGLKASKRKPDLLHPFGYGKTLYFFSFIVALFIFCLGGGVSIYKGITAWQAASAGHAELGDPLLNYIVLFAAMIIEGTSLFIAIREVNKERGEDSLWKFIRDCKDPSHFTVLLEDSAAELGLITALVGVFCSHVFNEPHVDAAASVIIGVLLIVVAIILLRETKGLLIGEGMDADEIEDVIAIVEGENEVRKCGRVLSMYMGPDDMLLALDVTFKDDIEELDVLRAIDRLEKSISDKYPQANRIFIEVESLGIVSRQNRHQRELIEEAEAAEAQ